MLCGVWLYAPHVHDRVECRSYQGESHTKFYQDDPHILIFIWFLFWWCIFFRLFFKFIIDVANYFDLISLFPVKVLLLLTLTLSPLTI